MSIVLRVCLLTLLLIGQCAGAHAEKRIALVIGNSGYKLISPLANPSNDAKLMASALRSVGFEVIEATDVDVRGMGRAIKKLGRKLAAAGKGAVGLFYFAGHGVQSRGENYLIPLNAEISREADLDIEAMAASSVLNQMQSAGNTLNLVILDACRNNPFKSGFRSANRGLSRIIAPSGSLIALSAAPGQVATDGKGENSPYTSALAKAMLIPDLPVEQMFKRVRISVGEATGNIQTPWEESSLKGNFYFMRSKPVEKPVTAAPAPAPVLRTRGNLQIELAFWNSVKDTKNPTILRAYIEQFPKGNFTNLARLKIIELEKHASLPKKPDAAPTEQNEQAEPLDPRELTRSIQKELKRVGCNPGSADGVWGKRSQRALAQFKARTSLKLATDKPSQHALDQIRKRKTIACVVETNRSLERKKKRKKDAARAKRKKKLAAKRRRSSRGPKFGTNACQRVLNLRERVCTRNGWGSRACATIIRTRKCYH